jgi:ATP-dependent RNA helicase DDX24/MAK5
MPKKQTTFKQRIRRNDLRARNEVSKDMKKRMRLSNRNHNRYDDENQSGRSMEELVQSVKAEGAGSVCARDVDLDPRALANLMLTGNKNTTSRQAKLPDVLPESHPAALPEAVADAGSGIFREPADNQGNNKNRYKHKGAPYLFWDRVGLHPLLQQALKTMKFTHPTPVQEEVLPTVLEFVPKTTGSKKRDLGADAAGAKKTRAAPGFLKEDIVVAAETGSGKTLVFALPILNHILLQMEANDEPLTYEAPAKVTTSKDATESAEAEEGSEEAAASEADAASAPKKRRTEDASGKKGKSTVGKKGKKADTTAAADDEESTPAAPDGAASVPPLPRRRPNQQRIMHSLIVSPTRELAVQIKAAMEQLTVHANAIRIGCVVGGMAQEKQQRVLNRMPHVLICTPGRLWDLLQHNEGCYLGHSISRRLKFVILDEADKLMQGGRFEELKMILERIHCEVLPAGFGQRVRDLNGDETIVEGADGDDENSDADTMETGRWDEEKKKFIAFTKAEKEAIKKPKGGQNEEGSVAPAPSGRGGAGKDRARPMDMPPSPEEGHRVGTFITSATLSLQTNYTRKDFKSSKSIIRTSNASTMQAVLNELQMREKMCKIFNMSPDAGVVAKINETFLRCPDASKDLYLYYFLRTYKERTIIFVNAISMLRRLTHILEVLGIPVVGLHASMQQRQRLKFIERFRSGEKRVLVATDIASRGIDIEGLRHVLHYQVPRSTDAYIHRCGRTARCGGTGLSVLMVNASEYVSFKKLLQSLGRSENSMETFSLESSVVHHLHPHMTLALQIDKLQREVGKTSAGARWVQRMSRETEIDADDMVDDANLKENASKLKVIKQLKYRLDDLTRKNNGHFGGKGGFRTGSKALGGVEANQKLRERADRQVVKGAKF